MTFNPIAPNNEPNYRIQSTCQNALDLIRVCTWTILLTILVEAFICSSICLIFGIINNWDNYIFKNFSKFIFAAGKWRPGGSNFRKLRTIFNVRYMQQIHSHRGYLHKYFSMIPKHHLCMVKFLESTTWVSWVLNGKWACLCIWLSTFEQRKIN